MKVPRVVPVVKARPIALPEQDGDPLAKVDGIRDAEQEETTRPQYAPDLREEPARRVMPMLEAVERRDDVETARLDRQRLSNDVHRVAPDAVVGHELRKIGPGEEVMRIAVNDVYVETDGRAQDPERAVAAADVEQTGAGAPDDGRLLEQAAAVGPDACFHEVGRPPSLDSLERDLQLGVASHAVAEYVLQCRPGRHLARFYRIGTVHNDKPSTVRVVLATTGGAYGRWIAEGLRERGVPISAVLVDVHRPTLRAAIRRPRRLVGSVRRYLQARPLDSVAPLVAVADINLPRGVRALRELAPDLLVLGGARILSGDVLSVPSMGTLNAHPARLPGFRGTGVVGWSILEGEPVTVTVHFASPDVDAGDVVARRLVPIEVDDDLEAIEGRADRLCADTLADVVARAWRGERIPREPQEASPIVYRWLDPEGRARCARLVAEGEALRLYRNAISA